MKKMRIILLCAWVIISQGFVSCNGSKKSEQIIIESDSDSQYEEISVASEICVYIVGEVMNPGVYILKEDSRVCDVVDLAGGFTENAAKEYINLASKVCDEEQIIVYSISQVENGEAASEEEASLININTATKELLMTLPGIGESRASDIISYREENGSFNSIEDIMKVPGIKESAFSKIENLITVR